MKSNGRWPRHRSRRDAKRSRSARTLCAAWKETSSACIDPVPHQLPRSGLQLRSTYVRCSSTQKAIRSAPDTERGSPQIRQRSRIGRSGKPVDLAGTIGAPSTHVPREAPQSSSLCQIPTPTRIVALFLYLPSARIKRTPYTANVVIGGQDTGGPWALAGHIAASARQRVCQDRDPAGIDESSRWRLGLGCPSAAHSTGALLRYPVERLLQHRPRPAVPGIDHDYRGQLRTGPVDQARRGAHWNQHARTRFTREHPSYPPATAVPRTPHTR